MNFSFQDEVKAKERAPPPNLDDERRRLVEVIIIIKSTIRDVCIPKQMQSAQKHCTSLIKSIHIV